jgi:hypothetical protein
MASISLSMVVRELYLTVALDPRVTGAWISKRWTWEKPSNQWEAFQVVPLSVSTLYPPGPVR